MFVAGLANGLFGFSLGQTDEMFGQRHGLLVILVEALHLGHKLNKFLQVSELFFTHLQLVFSRLELLKYFRLGQSHDDLLEGEDAGQSSRFDFGTLNGLLLQFLLARALLVNNHRLELLLEFPSKFQVLHDFIILGDGCFLVIVQFLTLAVILAIAIKFTLKIEDRLNLKIEDVMLYIL